MSIDHYLKFLEQVLTPKRLAHSLGAMQVMGELASVYGLDVEKARTIGLLHDAGKDLPPEQQKRLFEEANIEIHYECEMDYVFYLHGPVGSYFVQKNLGITDELILDAITVHTYYGNGKNFHHPMCWCLRFSDLLEPMRDWRQWAWFHDGVEELRNVVYEGRMEQGSHMHLGLLIKWFDEQGMPVHPNMRSYHQELSTRLQS